MPELNIPVGVSDFREIRQNGYYYIDKSGLIRELLKNTATKVTLITRPRRFGKTLSMSMLENFFDIRKDSRAWFEGLEIARDSELCQAWMNQWPTVFFSLKDIDGLNFESAYGQLKAQISELYKKYAYLLEYDAIDPDDKQNFLDLKAGRAGEVQVSRALSLLLRIMEAYYQKPVILLLDEYDVPVAKASSNGYYEQMLEVIKTMMSTALKDNSCLRFAVITGCLKIAKESIFTGTNNLVSDTIGTSGLNEYFGFTQKDVDRLLEDAGANSQAENIKVWYDGYRFGNFEVYCPWDVMNYLRDFQQNPEARPVSYWKNTSDNAIIRSFIDYAGGAITKKLETLLSGGYILQHIDENLTYDYLHSSEDNLWSVLYLTGYLTGLREEELPGVVPDGMTALRIPNEEIREIFETTIRKWFDDSAKTWNRKDLFASIWQGDSEAATEEINKLLRRTISYHDYREDFYHAFLAGIFTGAGYAVESNKEHGEGRSDIVVSDYTDGWVAIFEIKYSDSPEELETDCEKAIRQMDERMYAVEYEEQYPAERILCYGISFFKKRCLVKKKA
ncbi:AAA family ATPase [Laedolimicola ammoniilytica]|uniref:ATP-binding protein n=1 Tax=Laedolimicola ammoniilytica TaxID=2981771 RepID=A0ABT2RWK9_9FIRM|nr:AAA family ATPase [Laedolimicola ammoniilytica]MCU6696704.1 ATP-binding protein [Laedolimicola ammoniilytica]SCH86671.1 Predicted AAA-ATPase [uncultured Clostridium sp.]